MSVLLGGAFDERQLNTRCPRRYLLQPATTTLHAGLSRIVVVSLQITGSERRAEDQLSSSENGDCIRESARNNGTINRLHGMRI